jgi:hypothetical protein
MNNQPILFYSTRCSHSQQILSTLKAMNKESLCRLFSIDGRQRHELPPFLKSVPTLYVPESKDVYIGKDIYTYIAKPVQSRREIPTETPAQKAAANPAPTAEYQAWTFEGAKGLTESYANWANPTSFTSDNQLNFTFLSGVSGIGPVEPQTKQSYDGDKYGRNEDISKRLEEYKKVRESEFKGVERQ